MLSGGTRSDSSVRETADKTEFERFSRELGTGERIVLFGRSLPSARKSRRDFVFRVVFVPGLFVAFCYSAVFIRDTFPGVLCAVDPAVLLVCFVGLAPVVFLIALTTVKAFARPDSEPTDDLRSPKYIVLTNYRMMIRAGDAITTVCVRDKISKVSMRDGNATLDALGLP